MGLAMCQLPTPLPLGVPTMEVPRAGLTLSPVVGAEWLALQVSFILEVPQPSLCLGTC